jgi:hypothetical protein
MKKTLFVLLILGLGFASCNKEPQPLTKEEIKQKIDSITKVRIIESDNLAKRDLERRIKIEVKVKADSIVSALQQVTKDTTKNHTMPASAQRPPFSATGRVPKSAGN